MEFAWIVIIAVIAVIGIFLWSTYNGLVTLNVRVDEAWSDITVQLKRRADLIPNLIETVKGYATHEREVFENVTKARAATISPTVMADPAAAAVAEDGFHAAMKSLFAVAEAYPQLQANQNFLSLQQELTDTEDKIMAARRFYNGAVRDLNTKIQVFPTNFFAGLMRIKNREFFGVDEGEAAAVAEPVKVDFSTSNKK